MDYFESGFFGGNQEAWHGMGTVIPEDVVTAADAITLAELDWKVLKRPVYVDLPGAEDVTILPDYCATVRDRDNRTLGIVGKDYTPVQNVEAFDFVDTLLASDEAKYHTAGSLKDGRQVWLLARLNRDILIGGEESERIAPFILLSNGHDGSHGLTVAVTPIRVVCWNTLSYALSKSKRTWATRHTSGITDRVALATEAAETLQLSYKFFDRLEAVGTQLAGEKFSDADFDKFLQTLMPLPDKEKSVRAFRGAEEKQEVIRKIFRTEDNLANVRNTKWAALQAVTQYHDHEKRIRTKDEDDQRVRRFERSLFETQAKTRALALLAPTAAPRQRQRQEQEGDLALV
jgi:phage/plasmid-like protein (TIGR03299 family)